MTTTDAGTLQTADSELVRRAVVGEETAFEELYRRHSQAAWRVAQAVTHNQHDAADAVSEAFTKVFQALPAGRLSEGGANFRSYLMAATRNAAIDGLRRSGKVAPSDSTLVLDIADTKSGPTERAVETLDASLVAQAFSTLPERWRTILWLTEVEGMAPRDAAVVLDLTPNGAAQLAVRAREGLRERYLQVHLTSVVDAACNATVPLLGAYVAGGLSARDAGKVDQHLVDCGDCRDRVAELEDLQSTLRRIALPFPAILASLTAGGALVAKLGLPTAYGAHVAAGGAADPGLIGRTLGTSPAKPFGTLQKPLAYASGALVAIGFIGAAIVQPERNFETSVGQRPSPAQVLPSPAALGDEVASGQVSTFAAGSTVTPRQGGGAQITSSTPPSGSGPGSRPPAAPKPPEPVPIANASARLGDGSQTLAASAGAGSGSCTGVQVGTTVAGCPPAPQKKGKQLTVSTGGSVPGTHEISAP